MSLRQRECSNHSQGANQLTRIMSNFKRKRRNAISTLVPSKLKFKDAIALADWIANNIEDQRKQEKLMLQGVRNQYTIEVTASDTSHWVTRSPICLN